MRCIGKHLGFGVYERRPRERAQGESRYAAFLPGETPGQMDSPEWEADSLKEITEFIDSYELPA